MKRNGISFLVLVLLLAIVLITVLVFLPLIPGQEEGEWMVSPLQVEGNQVFLVGPDLTDLVEERLVYTYYSRGQWVSLEWMGYEDGVNVWLIPETLQSERPDWALNSNWTLDFLWPENGGSPPEGSFLGTSSE